MNVANIIFAKIKILGLLPVVVAITAFPAVAADNGCNNTANNRITPALALCSTHAYNIGHTENPTTAADKQAMRDVIALKSTVIMQQMKKQYDYLDATISRLKTQLEREILTTNFAAAGASTSSSSSASTGDRNIYLAGTSNCNNETTTSDVYTCLRNNFYLIYNMSNGGTNLTIELRRQLANDYKVMRDNAGGVSGFTPTTVSVNGNSNFDCTNYNNLSGRTEFQACMDSLNANIRSATTKLSNQQQNNNMQWR